MARIFVVDDRADSRDYLATLLRHVGHDVAEANSGSSALFKLRTESPDLIFADILMPDLDGYGLARELRLDPSKSSIPIIFWTAAYSPESARVLADYCGVDFILPKPSEPEAILAAVNAVLSRPPRKVQGPSKEDFEREHETVLNQKIFDQIRELETTTERLRESESQYRSLFEGNPLAIWIVDEQTGRFQTVNEAAVCLYGYSLEEFLGLSAKDLIVGDESTSPVADSWTRVAERHRVKSGGVIEIESITQRIHFGRQGALLQLIDDVTQKNEAKRSMLESREQLRLLGERLRSVQEEERTRISRDMHDVMGQNLSALRLTCDWILKQIPEMLPKEPSSDIRRMLNSSIVAIDEMISFVQKTAAELRPGILDEGIGAAIEWSATEFQSRSGIACHVELSDDEAELDTARATEVYRIFQEALTNVARHSGASSLRVKLEHEPARLGLSVQDNGRGITPEEANSRHATGILGMRERAALIGGVVSVSGSPDSGTLVRLEVPLASGAAA